jgi:uncharacterized protein (TIGR03435 family)
MSSKIVLAAFCTAAAALAQAPPAGPAFEVASIKTAEPLTREMVLSGRLHIGMKVDNARVQIDSFSIQELVRFAYNLKPYQVSGPDWITHLRYDIVAKLPDGATTEQIRPMVQRLLADRFKLVIHHETKDQPVYALVVGKNGPKLKDAAPDAVPAAPAANAPREMNVSGNGEGVSMTGGTFGNLRMVQGDDGKMRLVSPAATMTTVTDMLSRMMDRPVVDMTGLKGNYQISIDLDDEDLRNLAAAAGINLPLRGGRGGGEAADPTHSSVFQSIQQLGLKLEPRKAPMDLLVVDSAEKVPTEN